MILDAIFTVVGAVLNAVFSALPSFSLAPSLTPVTAAGQSMGHYMAIVNAMLPLNTLVTVAHDTYSVLLPALVVYKIANWVWRHIPDLWGFGPGSG